MDKKLSVFTNDYEWVIAETRGDAIAIVKETTGYLYDSGEVDEWGALSDDVKLSIWMMNESVAEIEEEGSTLITKTCKEWIEQFGRSYLCSSEM